MAKYRGFFQLDRVITNGSAAHNTDAVDIEGDKGTPTFAPFEVGNANKLQWKVIRSNKVDPAASNVIYTAIKRQDGDRVEFAYFHTNKCPYAVGKIISSGDPLCYLDWNGSMTGYHVHLSPRNNDMKTHLNPANYVATNTGKIALGAKVLGKPNIITKPMNIQAGTTIQVITTDKLNIRKVPDTSGEVVGQLDPGAKTLVVFSATQSPIADGYEWSPIKEGWIAVQVMATGAQWVKVIALPETCEQKVARLEAEAKLLNLEIEALESEKAVLQKTVDEQAKKLNDIKAIVNT